MEMELFQPNNLSRVRPEFTPVDDPLLVGHIAEILGAYRSEGINDLQIARFDGVNLSSQNFLTKLGSERFLLKLRRSEELGRLRAEAELAMRFAGMGLKVPRVVSTQDGRAASGKGDSCCVLYVFEEGNYFNGHGRELRSAAEGFAELTDAAREIFGDSLVAQGCENQSRFAELETLLRDCALKDDPEVASLCVAHRDTILDNVHKLGKERHIVESRRLALHLDYHPLNLLMRDEEVACILDLEHVKVYPVLAGLGFAGFKLIRQAMVDPEIRAREFLQPSLVTDWLNGWTGRFPDLRFSPAELMLGARYQILAIIHLILKKWIERGDAQSNYDLAKQIGSLYEIDAIARLY
jgi:Ser/Thr protein kinase RdoA (MazF antagonist)